MPPINATKSKADPNKIGKTTRTTRATKNSFEQTPTSTHKRLRSPDSASSSDTSNKKVKTVKLSKKDMEELKNFIAENSTKLEKQISESQTSLQNSLVDKFDDLATNVNAEVSAIKTSVESFKTEVSNEVTEIKTQLNEQKSSIELNADAILRMERNHILRLAGFKHKDKEVLFTHIEKIAAEIKFNSFSQSIVPTIERIPYKDKKTGKMVPSDTILIRFVETRQKELFYSCYLKSMPLNPKNFGLPESSRISMGEFLTQKNASIFKRALLLKKDKKIAQAYTVNGLVRIRFVKGKSEDTHTITDITALEALVLQHASQPTQAENAPKGTTQSNTPATNNNATETAATNNNAAEAPTTSTQQTEQQSNDTETAIVQHETTNVNMETD